jgi:chromosome segregation ATPase
MEKQDIINLLELVKHNQLQSLQAKVENLRNDMDMLENEKMKAASTLFRLKRMIGEAEESLAQKRREITRLNQESGKSDNTGNSDPVTYSEPDTSSDSI